KGDQPDVSSQCPGLVPKHPISRVRHYVLDVECRFLQEISRKNLKDSNMDAVRWTRLRPPDAERELQLLRRLQKPVHPFERRPIPSGVIFRCHRPSRIFRPERVRQRRKPIRRVVVELVERRVLEELGPSTTNRPNQESCDDPACWIG